MARTRLNYPAAQEGVAGTVRITGRFTTAGSSAPTVKSTGPWSIAAPSTGVYTLTFNEIFTEVLGVQMHLSDATGSSKRVIATSWSAGSSPNTSATLVFETQSTVGTAANLTGPVVHFDIAFRKGSLTK